MIVSVSRRLALRQFVDVDLSPMTAVFGDPVVMHFGDGPKPGDWIRSWINRAIADYESYGFGHWAIVLEGAEKPIGYCGLERFDDINGCPEIELGYRLAKSYWGCGLATEAAMSARDLAFDKFGITRLISLIDPANSRSIRVAEKLGMVHTDDVALPGYLHPDRVYTCMREFG